MISKRKLGIILIIVLFLSIGLIVFNLYHGTPTLITDEEALKIGEEKYQQFLWIIDGVFNSSRYKENYFVNGKEIQEENKLIVCKYLNKKSCVVDNFEKEFASLFARSIRIDNVYGDGLSFRWYEENNHHYTFTNMNTCSISRMGLYHKLEVVEIKDDKIVYQVSFNDVINNDERLLKKKFILIQEDNNWKISKAYYHDLCHMDYFIE